MTELSEGLAVGLLAIGAIVILSVVVRFVSDKIIVPAVAGYILTGVAIGLIDNQWQLFSETAHHGLALIAEIGIIVILFRVGLESDLESLVRVLGKAVVIFAFNFVVSGVLVARWLAVSRTTLRNVESRPVRLRPAGRPF